MEARSHLVVLCLLALAAQARGAELSIALDLDGNSSTGCSFRGFAGADELVVTELTLDPPRRITAVAKRTCSGGSFDPATSIRDRGWPVGVDPDTGALHIETLVPMAGLNIPDRIGFALDSSELQTVTIPRRGRRRAAGTGPPAAHLVPELDGEIEEWSGITRIRANDSDSLFLWPAPGTLYLRFDLQLALPVARDDFFAMRAGAVLNVAAPGLLANDSDAYGASLTASVQSAPTAGSLSMQPDGAFTYSHSGGPEISDTFTYTASSASGMSAPATVAIGITQNSPIQAVADSYSVSRGATLTIGDPGVLANDVDLDTPRAAWTSTILTPPANGTLTLNPGGGFTYVHGGGTATTDTFVYRASDGASTSDGTVTLNILAVNAPPIAAADTYATTEDTPLVIAAPGVLGNDSDPESNPLSATIVTNAANGTVTLSADGSFTYTPAADANGVDSFTYAASDGALTSATVAVTIAVAPANDPPSFAAGANVFVAEDSGAYGAAWATAISAGPGESDPLAFSVTNDASALFSTQPSLSAAGVLTFTPASDANGSANVSVSLSDGTSSTAPLSFTITITPVNDPPSFTPGTDVTVGEDSGAYGAAWATAIGSGPNESNPLTFTVTNDNNALFAAQPALSAGGVLTFTPAPDANGSANVSVTLSDGSASTAAILFTINVTKVNDPPSFTKGADRNVAEDSGAHAVAGWATAISAGPADESAQPLTFTLTNTSNALFSAQPAVAGNGDLTFTPAPDAFGTATVTVQLSDGVATFSDTFVITVANVNDAPLFTTGGGVTVAEDGGPYSAAWASAISAGPGESDVLTFATTNDNNALFAVQPAVAANGTLTFLPAADANGSATVTVTLSDGAITTAPLTFQITVSAVDDPPRFTAGANQVVDEDAGERFIGGWATGIAAGPPDEVQPLTFTTTNDNNALFSMQPDVDAAGDLRYSTMSDAFGTANVTVQLSDGALTFTRTFTITINPINDPPSFAGGGDVTVAEDGGAYDAPWASAISTGPANETQTPSFSAAITSVTSAHPALFSAGPAIDSATGNLSFQALPDVNGSATVEITLNDGAGGMVIGSFTIAITAVNDPPTYVVAGSPPFVLAGSGAQSVAGFVTSYSPGPLDEAAQTSTVTTSNDNNALFLVQPSIDLGTAALTYTPAPGVFGTATVTTFVTDNGGGTDTSPVRTFTIAVERPPSVVATTPANGATAVALGTSIAVQFDEAVHAAATAFTVVCSSGPIAVAVTGNNTTTLVLTPVAALPDGPCTVTVLGGDAAIHDDDLLDPPDGIAAPYAFSFQAGQPPVANDDSVNTLANLTRTIADIDGVLANDTDPDGTPLTIQNAGTLLPTARGGTITFTPGGGYTYNSALNDAGAVDSVAYTVTDGNATDTGTLTIQVGPRVLFVDDVATNGDGREIAPFNSLQAAEGGSTSGDVILVKSGSYSDFITLKPSQKLIGQGIAAPHIVTFNATPIAVLAPGASPLALRTTAGTTLTLSTNNEIRGLSLSSSNGHAIVGNGFGTVTIREVVASANGGGVSFDNGVLDVVFTSLSSANSAGNGVRLANVTGTFDAPAGSITDAAAIGFSVNTIGANVSYGGSLSNSPGDGLLIELLGQTGGTLTLSGNLLANGGGISLSSSVTGVVNLNGVSKVINASVQINHPSATFANGGLAINTTTAIALHAQNGTLQITGAGNTITTTAATPIEMLDVNTGTLGIHFQSVSAGGSTAMFLSNVSGSGGLHITGTGTPGTGGTLNTFDGLVLLNVSLLELSWMNITVSTAAITGTNVTLTGTGTSITAGEAAFDLTGGSLNAAFGNVSTSGGVNAVVLNNVSGTWSTAGGTVSGTSGAPFLINGGTGNMTWRGDVTAPAVPLLSLPINHPGTLTFSTGTITVGGTLSFGATAKGTYTFDGPTTADGIAVLGATGTFTFGTGTAITNPSVAAFEATGAPKVTFHGTLTRSGASAGRLVMLSSIAAGAVITFSPSSALTATSSAGTGIRIFSCTGGTISFNSTATMTGASNGVEIDTVSSAVPLSFGSAVSITNTNGPAVYVGSSGVPLNFHGSLTKDGTTPGRILHFFDLFSGSGAPIVFDGPITATSSNGSGIFYGSVRMPVNISGPLVMSGGDNAVDVENSNTTVQISIGSAASPASITNPSGVAFRTANNSPGALIQYNGNITQTGPVNLVELTDTQPAVVFANGTLSGTGAAAGILISGLSGAVTFAGTMTLDGGSIRYSGVNLPLTPTSHSYSAQTSVANTDGPNFAIAGAKVNISFSGTLTKTGPQGGQLVDIDSLFGNANFEASSVLTSTGSGGSGIRIINSDNGSTRFLGTTTLANGNNGLHLQDSGLPSTHTFGPNFSVTNPGGTAVRLLGTTGGVTFQGSITKDGTSPGLALHLSGGGGATSNFTGPITATSSAGDGLLFGGLSKTTNVTGPITLSGGNNRVSIIGQGGALLTIGSPANPVSVTNPSGAAFSCASSGTTATITFHGNITQNNAARVVDINDCRNNFTFSSGTLTGNGSDGIHFAAQGSTVNFNSPVVLTGGTSGITWNNVVFGDYSFAGGSSITNPSGTALVANARGVFITWRGSISKDGTSPGRLITAAPPPGFTIGPQLNFTATSVLTATSSSGTGISLDRPNGASFAGTTTLSGGDNGIDVVTSTGLTSFGAGTSIANPLNEAITVNGSTGGTFAYAGTVTGTAISLTNNTGGTIRFTGGGVDVATFTATGGGTVTVEGAGNTLTSALQIEDTGIGPAGVTFDSISSSGGAIPAILLDAAGAGTLTVNGGTISGKSGDAISVAAVGGVRLNSMNISGSGLAAVRGAGVGVLQLTGSTIAGNGAGLVLTGSAAATCANISGNTFTGSSPLIQITQGTGAFSVTQKAPTAATDPLELDDANGITPADIATTGAITFAQPPCVAP